MVDPCQLNQLHRPSLLHTREPVFRKVVKKYIYTCFIAELKSVLCAIMKPDILLLLVNKHEVSKTERKLSGILPFCKGYSSFSIATECSLSKIRQLGKV